MSTATTAPPTNKKLFVARLAFFFTLSTLLVCCVMSFLNPQQAYAQGDVDEQGNFVTKGDTIYGLSAAGIKYVQENDGQLVLPARSNDGTALTRIASFAFTPNKSKAIDDYVGRPGENGTVNNLDVEGNPVEKLGQDFSNTLISSVVIPEGYLSIGQDAFDFNRSLHEVSFPASIRSMSDYAFAHTALSSIELPAQLKHLGDQVFFECRITGTLELPSGLEQLGERVFKGNRISDIHFNNAIVPKLDEAVFEDNKLSRVAIPASIKEIAPDAFNANPGDENYGNFVVLTTPDGTNPNKLPDHGNYYIDPRDDKRTTPSDIDTSSWNEDDFSYDGDTITGFSGTGQIKIRKNKNLKIPSEHKGTIIKKIATNAFRNVDLSGNQLKKYDIESVELPESLEEIGDFAFQSNLISELTLDPDAPLKKIGAGAFMNNQIEMLSLPSGLEYIGDAAFHINDINMVLIPRETRYLGRSAFRQNNITIMLGFEEGSKLQEIGEMAFAESHLAIALFDEAHELKTIGVQAFADNELAELTLPDSLERIASEAFAKNQLTELPVGAALKEISFNAFDNNPGSAHYSNKVLISLPDSVTSTNLADGNNFVINPQLTTSDTSDIKAMLEKLKGIKLEELRDETAKTVQSLIDEAEALLKRADTEGSLSQGSVNDYRFRSGFWLDLLDLDKQIKRADSNLSEGRGRDDDRKLLSELHEYAKKHFTNAAWTQSKRQRIVHELDLLNGLVEGVGPLAQAKLVQGVYELHSSLPIPSYFIGVNVYFADDGSIVYVFDRSYTIGEGQLDDYGNPIENVDEDNEGYHQLALETLPDYAGKKAEDIVKNDVDGIGGIRVVDQAKDHRAGLYEAIKDAARDYLAAEQEDSDSGSQPAPGSGENPAHQHDSDTAQNNGTQNSSENLNRKQLPQTADASMTLSSFTAAGLALGTLGVFIRRKH